MNQRRLVWLVLLMCTLAVLRVVVPSSTQEASPPVAEAIVRKPPPSQSAAAAKRLPSNVPVRTFSQAEEVDDPGNAFAVRPPPPAPKPAPVVAAKAPPAPLPVVPVIAIAPTEPPAPPMPYKVIGTWDDGQAPGVFLSSPTGTVLARPGATLQAEYKVVAITPQQISLLHLATQREVRLAVTRPPATPRSYP